MSSAQEVGTIFATADAPHGPTTTLLRSPTVIIASIGLWAMNVYLFDLFGLDYKRVLRTKANNATPTRSLSFEMQQNDEESSNMATQTSLHASINNARSSVKGGVADDIYANNSAVAMDDDDGEVTAGKLFFLCFLLLLTLHMTTEFWLHVIGGNNFGAVLFFYVVCIGFYLCPYTRADWLVTALFTVVERILSLFTPKCGEMPQTTPFVDVFFADAMCSLSKVFFDWGMLATMLYHYPNSIPESLSSIALPSVLSSLPYVVRARQCIVSFNAGKLKQDPKRHSHLLNAIKYSTSLFPICLSAYQKTLSQEHVHDFDILFVMLLVINSIYSFLWDIFMDWGMAQDLHLAFSSPCAMKDDNLKRGLLRQRLRFGVLLSAIIIFGDLCLRFSWTLRFYHASLFSSFDSFVLLTQFLEVFRRAIWNLLRVEWEIIKTSPPPGKGKENFSDKTVEFAPLVPQIRNVKMEMSPVSTRLQTGK